MSFGKKTPSRQQFAIKSQSCDHQKVFKNDTSSHTENLTDYTTRTFAHLVIELFQASPTNDWPLQGLYVLLRHVLEAGCLVDSSTSLICGLISEKLTCQINYSWFWCLLQTHEHVDYILLLPINYRQ